MQSAKNHVHESIRAATPVSRWSWTIATLAAVVACLAYAAEPSPIDALRAKFPHGIPWHVEFADTGGQSLGTIDMRITSERGDSCLGDMDSGVRVEFVRKENFSPTLSITSHGVAKFTGNKVTIDLTGGRCDAYLLMDGEVAANGSSNGEVSTFGMRGGKPAGKYRATVQ